MFKDVKKSKRKYPYKTQMISFNSNSLKSSFFNKISFVLLERNLKIHRNQQAKLLDLFLDYSEGFFAFSISFLQPFSISF